MSKVSIKGNQSGTGVFTLAAPDSDFNRTLTLPDEAGSVLTDVSDIEPQVKTATNATGTAPIYACRAWVNFDGIGTVSIRESGNVSSITDNGTGTFKINLTVDLPDTNYTLSGFTEGGATNSSFISVDNRTTELTTSGPNIIVRNSDTSSMSNREFIGVQIFR